MNVATTTDAGPTIYLDVDGKPEPLSNLVWTAWQACGCMSGVSTADSGPDHQLITEEQARASMRDSKVQIQRAIDDGETYRLMTWETYRALGKWGECEHIPKWGIPVVEIPEGHVWATTDRWYRGRRSFTKHLVAETEVAEDSYSREAALCGKRPTRDGNTWGADRSDIRSTVTCRKCEATVSTAISSGVRP